jgi:hypothetical protein
VNIGDICWSVGDDVRRFPPLTVRQLVTMQSVLAERAAVDTGDDCRRLALSADETLLACRKSRDDARLSTAVVRWCFTLDGALRLITESVGAANVDACVDGIAPDDLTDIALQIIGFEWSDDLGKWVRRARATGGAKLSAIT